MSDIRNNIFQYATKELSQDAIISWLLNWANYPDSELHTLSIELFHLLGIEDFKPKQRITIKTQIKKADIVVALHEQGILLIIEDKTTFSEHDDQIKQYVDFFMKIENQRLLDNVSDKLYDVRTVYFKTGYYYDDDKTVKADVKVNAEQFYKILSQKKYSNISEILDEYVIHLKKIMDDDVKYGDFCGEDKSAGRYISWKAIAQHNLMRYIFHEEYWDEKSDVFRVKNGSSSGRPFTTIKICDVMHHANINEDDKFSLFWRIDTNSKGPYLSLRIYDNGFDKIDNTNKKRHSNIYEKYIDHIKEFFSQITKRFHIKWDDVKERYTGNYKDSSLISFNLDSYLKNWVNEGSELKKMINEITADVLKWTLANK